MIEEYKFGVIKISGKTYKSDVIIYPEHVDAKWWRKQGHNLVLDDIKEVIDAHPEVIIVGTGQPGLMRVPAETIEQIKKLSIEMVILPTAEACQEYNRLAESKKAVACLHLTC